MPVKTRIPHDLLNKIEADLQSQSKKKSIGLNQWSKILKLSDKTLYRQFEKPVKTRYPEQIPYEQLEKIACFKVASLDKKGTCLSTKDIVNELKRKGELPQNFNFTRGTIDRLLRKYDLDIAYVNQSSPAIHLVSYFPNQVHEVDSTVAPTYYLNNFGRVAWDPFAEARKRPKSKSPYRLILYSGWDHCSSALYGKYFLAHGENSVDLFHFLYEFWSRKKDSALPFYGFPTQYLYTDQGGIFKSKSIVTLMERLQKICGFVHKKHMPGEPRATGGVESSFNTLKSFEKKLRFRVQHGEHPTLEDLNSWLYEFLVDINNDKARAGAARVVHRFGPKKSRPPCSRRLRTF